MVNVTKLCLLATAWAGAVLASNTVTDGVRTIAGELVTVAVESDLDVDGQTAGKVVLTEGGRAGCGAGRRLRGRGRMDVHGRAAGGGRHGVRAEGARAGDAGERDLDADGVRFGRGLHLSRRRGGGTGAPDLALLLQQRHAHRREVTR